MNRASSNRSSQVIWLLSLLVVASMIIGTVLSVVPRPKPRPTPTAPRPTVTATRMPPTPTLMVPQSAPTP